MEHAQAALVGIVRVVDQDHHAAIGRREAEQLCGGSLAPLLTHLVRARRLSAQERQDRRDMIDDLDRKNKSKGDRR